MLNGRNKATCFVGSDKLQLYIIKVGVFILIVLCPLIVFDKFYIFNGYILNSSWFGFKSGFDLTTYYKAVTICLISTLTALCVVRKLTLQLLAAIVFTTLFVASSWDNLAYSFLGFPTWYGGLAILPCLLLFCAANIRGLNAYRSWSLLPICLIALCQQYANEMISSTIGNSNYLGLFLIVTWPSLLHFKSKFKIPIACLTFITLILTNSQSAWLAAVIQGVALWRPARKHITHATTACMLAYPALIQVLKYLPVEFASGRGWIWRKTLPMLDGKFWLGAGAGMYPLKFDQVGDTDRIRLFGEQLAIIGPHNMFVHIWHDAGMLAMLCFMLLLAMSLLNGNKSIKLAIIGLLVCGQTNDMLVGCTPVIFSLFQQVSPPPSPIFFDITTYPQQLTTQEETPPGVIFKQTIQPQIQSIFFRFWYTKSVRKHL